MISSYKGDWFRNQMHGKGVCHYQTGFIWSGMFEYDSIRSEGLLTSPNNSKIEARMSSSSVPEGRVHLWTEDEQHNLVKFSGLVTGDLMIRPDSKTTGVDIVSHPCFFNFSLSFS